MNKQLNLKVAVHLTDCGDGSHSISLYSSIEDIKKEVAANQKIPIEEVDFDDNPYQFGYVENHTIPIEIDMGGNATITKSVYLGNHG